MNEMPTARYGTILLRPRTAQFFIDNLPLLSLDLGSYACAGMEGLPFADMLLWISVAVSLVLAYRYLYLKRTAYRITGEQLIHEHGVFMRSNEYIELYRVVDFGERSSLLQQLLGLKTVSVYSGDRTTPKLDLTGMDGKREIVPAIRERVEWNKRNKSIYEITNR